MASECYDNEQLNDALSSQQYLDYELRPHSIADRSHRLYYISCNVKYMILSFQIRYFLLKASKSLITCTLRDHHLNSKQKILTTMMTLELKLFQILSKRRYVD